TVRALRDAPAPPGGGMPAVPGVDRQGGRPIMPPARQEASALPEFPLEETIMATATAKRAAAPAVRETRLFINNEWADPVEGKTFDPLSPATGEVIAKVAHAGPQDVDRAVKAARRALESGPWATMDAADRGRLLFKLADLIEKNAEELAVLESLNC